MLLLQAAGGFAQAQAMAAALSASSVVTPPRRGRGSRGGGLNSPRGRKLGVKLKRLDGSGDFASTGMRSGGSGRARGLGGRGRPRGSAAAAADSAATALAATALTAPGWVSSQRARGAAARADARRRALCFVLGGKEARRREDE